MWYLNSFSPLFFMIKSLRGHPGGGQRIHVPISCREPVESLQQDISVASGLQDRVAGFVYRGKKMNNGRDEALQTSGCDQLLGNSSWKETNPHDCVVQLLFSIEYLHLILELHQYHF